MLVASIETYYSKKDRMKTEKTLTFIFLTGIILKLIHWPGGSLLVIMSLSLLSLLYFPASFYFFRDKDFKTQNLIFSIVSGLFLSIAPIGIMFKLQFWPGSKDILNMAIISTPTILIISYFLKSKSPDHLITYYKNQIRRSIVLTFITILFFLTPNNTLLKIRYNHPELPKTHHHVLEQVYTDSINNFSIKFPKGWTFSNNTNKYTLIAAGPILLNNSKNKMVRDGGFVIDIKKFDEIPSVESYYLGNIEEISKTYSDFYTLEENSIFIDGVRGLYTEHQCKVSKLPIKSVQVYFIHKNKGYILSGTATTEKFEKYRDLYIEIARSFKFKN